MTLKEFLYPPNMFFTPTDTQAELVWYCPEWDLLHVAKWSDGFIFENEQGKFHLLYKMDSFKTSPAYLIGEL